MPRVALPDSLQPCKISGCLYTPYIRDNIVSPASSLISKTIEDLLLQCTFQDPAGYPQILDIIDLRPLRGQHAYKASLRSALPDSLQLCSEIWVSLHFV
jgi:hypothetical protein